MQPKSYILYSRCSTDEQRQKGHSHEYQADGIRRSGTVTVGRLEEVAYLFDTVSGTRFDNRAAGLDAAYKICERNRGTVDYLFVYRWDRLGRDVADCFECIKRFRAVGVEVNCPDEWIDFNDPSYPLILSVKFGMAQSESMRISDRTRDGIHQVLSQGFWTAHPPVGYRKGPVTLIDGKERRLCEPDPAKADTVRRCFERYAAGETKADLFASAGKALGVAKSQFHRMFHNPFYCGLVFVKPHRSSGAQILPGRHEAIVSRELWDECQRIADTSEHPTKGKTWTQGADVVDSEFWLKGVLKCPITGRNMTAYRSRGKRGRYFAYYASQKIKGGQIIPAGRAHSIISAALAGLRISPEHYDEIRSEVARQMSERTTAASREADQAGKAIDRAKARLANIREQFADGNLNAEEYREMKAGFDKDLVANEARLEQARGRMQDNDHTIAQVLELLAGIDTVFAASAPEYKGRILRAVFPEGFSIEKNTGKVRTPCVNDVIFALCSKSIHSAVLEIENGPSFATRPVEGGRGDRYRTHYQAFKLLFAA